MATGLAWDRPEKDQLVGGAGNDTLFSDASDELSGGEGDDLLQYPDNRNSIDGTPLSPPVDVPSDVERTERYYTYACV